MSLNTAMVFIKSVHSRRKLGLVNMFSLARLVPGRRCRHYLSSFTKDDSLAEGLALLFTVKHCKQLALNKIVKQRLTVGTSMKVLGGKTFRSYRKGLLVRSNLSGETTTWSMKEPFGIDINARRIAVASGDEIKLFDMNKKTTTIFTFRWMTQLHSVSFSADGNRLLVAATGYDTVLEFEIETGELTWFWNSWDNGYDRSPNGTRFRRTETGIDLKEKNHNTISVRSIDRNEFGLPTGLTSTHLNNAQYFSSNQICITLFHQGKAIIVDRLTGEVSEVVGGLLNPHGFEPAWFGEKVVTDTRRGRVIFFDKDFLVKRTLIFDADEITQGREGLGEWLQNMLPLREGLYAAIDIHRSCIWVVDMEAKRYRVVPVSSAWAVQNVVALDNSLMNNVPDAINDYPRSTKEISDPEGLSAIQ